MNELIEYRKSQKLSQKSLAKLIGISQSVLCEYELGIKRPSPKTALKIEQATNISAAKLVFPLIAKEASNPWLTQHPATSTLKQAHADG